MSLLHVTNYVPNPSFEPYFALNEGWTPVGYPSGPVWGRDSIRQFSDSTYDYEVLAIAGWSVVEFKTRNQDRGFVSEPISVPAHMLVAFSWSVLTIAQRVELAILDAGTGDVLASVLIGQYDWDLSQRGRLTFRVGAAGAVQIRLMSRDFYSTWDYPDVNPNNAFVALDAWMLCDAAWTGPYIDGDMPGCAWTGDAHASPSTLTVETLEPMSGWYLLRPEARTNLIANSMFPWWANEWVDPTAGWEWQERYYQYGNLPGDLIAHDEIGVSGPGYLGAVLASQWDAVRSPALTLAAGDYAASFSLGMDAPGWVLVTLEAPDTTIQAMRAILPGGQDSLSWRRFHWALADLPAGTYHLAFRPLGRMVREQTIRLDAVQVEAGREPSTFIDGAAPGCAWAGQAFFSVASRGATAPGGVFSPLAAYDGLVLSAVYGTYGPPADDAPWRLVIEMAYAGSDQEQGRMRRALLADLAPGNVATLVQVLDTGLRTWTVQGAWQFRRIDNGARMIARYDALVLDRVGDQMSEAGLTNWVYTEPDVAHTHVLLGEPDGWRYLANAPMYHPRYRAEHARQTPGVLVLDQDTLLILEGADPVLGDLTLWRYDVSTETATQIGTLAGVVPWLIWPAIDGAVFAIGTELRAWTRGGCMVGGVSYPANSWLTLTSLPDTYDPAWRVWGLHLEPDGALGITVYPYTSEDSLSATVGRPLLARWSDAGGWEAVASVPDPADIALQDNDDDSLVHPRHLIFWNLRASLRRPDGYVLVTSSQLLVWDAQRGWRYWACNAFVLSRATINRVGDVLVLLDRAWTPSTMNTWPGWALLHRGGQWVALADNNSAPASAVNPWDGGAVVQGETTFWVRPKRPHIMGRNGSLPPRWLSLWGAAYRWEGQAWLFAPATVGASMLVPLSADRMVLVLANHGPAIQDVTVPGGGRRVRLWVSSASGDMDLIWLCNETTGDAMVFRDLRILRYQLACLDFEGDRLLMNGIAVPLAPYIALGSRWPGRFALAAGTNRLVVYCLGQDSPDSVAGALALRLTWTEDI